MVAEDSKVASETPVATEPGNYRHASYRPAATETEAPVLPEWVQGTNAATKSCSK